VQTRKEDKTKRRSPGNGQMNAGKRRKNKGAEGEKSEI